MPSILINFGVQEVWSNGRKMDVFQHSNTPILQYSATETYRNFGLPNITFILLIVPQGYPTRESIPNSFSLAGVGPPVAESQPTAW